MTKKLFLTIFCFINSIFYGQLTLDYSNFNKIGDSIIEHYDTNPNINFSISESGGNLTWDFTNLDSDFRDTLFFINPKKTLFWNDFKESNIALQMSSTDSVTMYFSHTKNNLLYHGAGSFNHLKEKEKYSINLRVINYPLKYLDEDYQVFTEEKILFKDKFGNDSIKKITREEYFDKVDSWGDLKMPSGIFFSLRIRRNILITETFYKFEENQWKKIDEKKYDNLLFQWWTDESKAKHPIVYFVTDKEQENVIHASFIDAIPFEKKIQTLNTKKIKVYPNTFKSYINVETKTNESFINIYSLQGALVFSNFFNEKRPRINLSNLNFGVYFLVVKDRNGKIVGKEKIIKQ